MSRIHASGRTGWVRLAAALALPLTAALGIAGCGAGQIAQSANQRSAVDGANADLGGIRMRDVSVLPPSAISYKPGATIDLKASIVNSAVTDDALVSVTYDGITGKVVTLVDAEAAESSSAAAASSADAAASSVSTASAAPANTAASNSDESDGADSSDGSTSSGPKTSSAATTGTAAAAPAESVSSLPLDLPTQSAVEFPADASITFVGVTEALFPSQVIAVTFVFEKAGSVTIDVPVGVPEDEVSNDATPYDFEGGEGEG